MTDKTYNGWTNWETWVVALWIDNEENSQTYWIEQAQELEQYDLSQALQSMYEEGSPLADQANLYTDLLNRSLARVNWYEIAGKFIDDAKEISEYDTGTE